MSKVDSPIHSSPSKSEKVNVNVSNSLRQNLSRCFSLTCQELVDGTADGRNQQPYMVDTISDTKAHLSGALNSVHITTKLVKWENYSKSSEKCTKRLVTSGRDSGITLGSVLLHV